LQTPAIQDGTDYGDLAESGKLNFLSPVGDLSGMC
jgi:hypothetical protein